MVYLVQIEDEMRPSLGAFVLFTYCLALLKIMHLVISLRGKQGKRRYPFEILSKKNGKLNCMIQILDNYGSDLAFARTI